MNDTALLFKPEEFYIVSTMAIYGGEDRKRSYSVDEILEIHGKVRNFENRLISAFAEREGIIPDQDKLRINRYDLSREDLAEVMESMANKGQLERDGDMFILAEWALGLYEFIYGYIEDSVTKRLEQIGVTEEDKKWLAEVFSKIREEEYPQ